MQQTEIYQQEIRKAKQTIGVLENELHLIRLKLQKNPTSAIFMQELKNIMIDMTITLNELEHAQYSLEKCISTP